MNCAGSKKLQKIFSCDEKLTENNSESFNCSSSTSISTAAEIDRKCETGKTGGKEKGGIFSSFFNSKIFFRGFRKNPKTEESTSMLKVERTIKAAILIQQWYRSYLARMEIRRRYTWTIFQSIEYQGEQDQVKVYDFFNALLLHMPGCSSEKEAEVFSKNSSLEFSDKFEDDSSDTSILESIENGYKGPHVSTPITFKDFQALIAHFRTSKHRLHAKYVAGILRESLKELKKLPNLNQASTAISKQITICGDLHGKLDDLLVIFHKNGLPSTENPYVFNGDFVDRGKKSLEILLLLLSCLTLFPGAIFLNRGNHEDHVMNQRYGFVKEVKSKYNRNAEKILKIIESVYRWIPLGTVIDKKVLVVHGGISDLTDLDCIKKIERQKYVSLLRPPLGDFLTSARAEIIDKHEWKQVFDLLWSDPQGHNGCIPNSLRGAGTYFGPDVTKKFLDKNKMSYIVRSHECKPWGYEMAHDDKVITIFSASNYYETGSNKGAYLKLTGDDLSPHFVQFNTFTNRMRKMTFRQRVGLIERSALQELSQKITSVRQQLSEEFRKYDSDDSGKITISNWCSAMEKCTGLRIPWRMLREKLAAIDWDTKKVIYGTTFQEGVPEGPKTGNVTVLETLYRNKTNLEAIFKIIDKDNSGYITLDEFSEACGLLSKHMPDSVPLDHLLDICRSMDINKDGQVDLNEFLETFRLVDIHGDVESPTDELDESSPTGTGFATPIKQEESL